MIQYDIPSLNSLKNTISNPENEIGSRMRATYYLRHLYEMKSDISNTEKSEILKILCENLETPKHGSLLRHEIAFVLGQIRNPEACETLRKILDSPNDCIIARHECGEALGAILTMDDSNCTKKSLELLEKYAHEETNPIIELKETCQIALEAIKFRNSPESEYIGCACMKSAYQSIDPAPPHPKYRNTSNEELSNILLYDSCLFDRYRVMFTLRNRNTFDSIQVLSNALVSDKSSALFRHEIAYVLGQCQNVNTSNDLIQTLENQNEHDMVRHEAAEALGAILEICSDNEIKSKLKHVLVKHSQNERKVVRESCIVALDAVDYWNDFAEKKIDEDQSSFSTLKNDNNFVMNHFNLESK